jgi:hypothetical protein
MGILESNLIPNRNVKKPLWVGGDFPDGLIITEYINGAPVNDTQVVLKGTFAPLAPFEFGGDQHIVKEYYPGSPIASAQVLGARESDITIRGNLKTKFLKLNKSSAVSLDDLRVAAELYSEQLDHMRRRGNLVQIQLGEWTRYGLIEKTVFRMKNRGEIEYEIGFFIQSEVFPDESRFTDRTDDDVFAPNSELKNEVNSQLDAARNIPDSMPQSIGDFLNSAINDVAEAVNVVTSFVDGMLNNIEQVQASVNRGIGLIRYASATISRTSRRIGTIVNTVENLGSSILSASGQAVATIENINHLNQTQRGMSSLLSYLSALRAKFAGLKASQPNVRHLVRENETLQRLAIRYYNNADHWSRIYEHNNMTTTELVVGSIIEIPRL